MHVIKPYQLHGYKSGRSSRAKRLSESTIVIGLIILGIVYSIYAFYRPLPSLYPALTGNNRSTAESVNITWPAYGQSAVGALSFGVLATSGLEKPVPIASTAKLMTALAVIDKYPLALNTQGPKITLTNNDVQIYRNYLNIQGSVVNVVAGEQISEYQALQAMLIASANNMADSLATWAFGSLSNYLGYANTRARNLGMNQSNFGSDASGFAPQTMSTAHDMVLLAEAVMQQPVLAQIVGQSSASLPNAAPFGNFNDLLGSHEIIGVKTGNTDQAKGCYVFAAAHNVDGSKVTVIGAILTAPNLTVAFKDTLPLLSSTFGGFTKQTLVHSGQTIANYRTPWGVVAIVNAEYDLSGVVWRGQNAEPIIKLDVIQAPLKSGQAVGNVSSNSSLDSVPLLLQSDIGPPNYWWRLLHNF